MVAAALFARLSAYGGLCAASDSCAKSYFQYLPKFVQLRLFGSWLGLLTALIPLASCQSRSSSSAAMPASHTDKFRLSAGPCAVDDYPATILEGRFINSLGGSFPVPYGHTLDGNWGRSGIGWAVGEEMQPVPDSLELRWFSYAEDKFYEGHWLMPQERLHALLKQGYWNAEEQKHETYGDFTVCVAPTGAAYVWLGGTNSVFIGRYQAREIQYDFAQFIPMADRAQVVKEGREHLPPHVKHEIATGTVSTKQWDAYLKTYPWKVAFSQPLTLTNFRRRLPQCRSHGRPAHGRPGPVPAACACPRPQARAQRCRVLPVRSLRPQSLVPGQLI